MFRERTIAWIDYASEGLIACLVVYLPFAFGGVLAQSAFVLVTVGAILAALMTARVALAPADTHAPWVLLPIAAFLGLVTL